MRFVGERKAVAAAVMAFFAVLFLMNSLMGPPEFMPMFVGLLGVYAMGFFGVVAGWFWARWFAMGVGFSGLVIGVILAWQLGLDPVVLIFGGTHLALVLALLGSGPAKAFEGRPEWRERWRMDENAVNRLGKAVTRAGASLPYLVMAGLAPKGAGLGVVALALGALALAAVGLRGLVTMRTWGVLALSAAAVLGVSAGAAMAGAAISAYPDVAGLSTVGVDRLAYAGAWGVLGGLAAAAAAAPFVRPLLRALRA